MHKNSIIYVGNMLSKKGSNQTSIETLALFLQNLNYDIKRTSDKKNQILRLVDMLYTIYKSSKKVDYILIDTYSTNGFWFAYISGILCSILKINYIPILRGGNLPERLKNNPKLCQTLFSKAYINIAPSNYLFQKFKKNGFKNLKLIPNTIEIKNYDFKERNLLKPKLLWVRAFSVIYNPLLALKVLKELLKEYPEAELCMVGPFKDNSIKDCKAYAGKNQLPVTFTGKLAKAKWVSYAKDFDIFINTTNVDNTPVSVIEAMALGLPVVSTNVGGLPYLLNHQKDAFLVEPDDKNAMFDAILNLLQNHKLAHHLSQNGRELAETFDWEVIKHKWQKILK